MGIAAPLATTPFGRSRGDVKEMEAPMMISNLIEGLRNQSYPELERMSAVRVNERHARPRNDCKERERIVGAKAKDEQRVQRCLKQYCSWRSASVLPSPR